MEDKTEVINLEQIKEEGKKRKTRKKSSKKINLGIWKYFIAIGGIAMATMIFFVILFDNSRGGLIEITMDDYLVSNKIQEKTLIYIGSNDAVSEELNPVIQDIAKKKNQQYQYLNIENITATEDITKIRNVFPETQDTLVVPMLIVVENGKIVDTRKNKNNGTATGLMVGYVDEASLIKFLKDNGVY